MQLKKCGQCFLRLLMPTLCFLSASMVQAQSRIISDFAFVISPSDYNRFRDNGNGKWEGKVQKDLGSFEFAKPYQTFVSTASLGLDYIFDSSHEISEPGVYPFTAKISNPKIRIASIVTKDQIQRNFGGSIITVQIEGSCSNIISEYKSDHDFIFLSGNIRATSIAGQLTLSLMDMNMSYDSSHWTYKMGHCSGPDGYGAVVEAKVREYLESHANVREAIIRGVEEQLTQTSTDISKEIFREQHIDVSNEIKLSFFPSSIDLQNSGEAFVMGVLSVDFINSRHGNEEYVEFETLDRSAKGLSRLIVPQQLLQKLSNGLFANGFYRQVIHPQKYSDLRSLFNSRLAQFFLWPDLLSFDKDADFIFDIYPITEPKVGGVSVDENQLRLHLAASIINNMLAPKDGGHLSYVNFWSSTRTVANLDVVANGVRVRFPTSRLNSIFQWDAKYLKKYSPTEYIRLSYIEGKLVDALEKQEVFIPVGPIHLNMSGKVFPQGFSINGKNIELTYSHKALTGSELSSSESKASVKKYEENYRYHDGR